MKNSEVFTTFVNPAIPIRELVDALARATGCQMGNEDVPWQSLAGIVAPPPRPSVETKIRLRECENDYSGAEAIALIGINGTDRPANARELIVFLTTFAGEQLKYPIVALGEPGDAAGPIVAYAYMVGGMRMLFIGRPSETCRWEVGCQFLVAEK